MKSELADIGARHLVSQGSDDGHALAGAISDGDLALSENSVINNIYQPVKKRLLLSSHYN